ncbi:hypothetical protein PIB30_026865 [Stylosanthes scabra]|uniref:Uncharacterized protein n=1 Tax=Stylosanthes scabra TaxID=79078 RepID=A0ABU6TB73_9FABA|nr:hypothetical protein [Stylosanthes scabra]
MCSEKDDVSSALLRGSITMDKSKARAQVLERYLNKLEDDYEFSKHEEEDDEEPQEGMPRLTSHFLVFGE